MTIQECLARNLKFYRNQKNFTQSQLAEKCDTSTNYIATIETGKKYPSPRTLEKIAEALGIEALDLFQIEVNDGNTKLNQRLEKIKKELKVEIVEAIDYIVK